MDCRNCKCSHTRRHTRPVWTLHLRAHSARWGQTPWFYYFQRRTTSFRAATLSSHVYSKQGLRVLSGILWDQDCAQGALLGPVDQAGHIRRDEGWLDNEDKATNEGRVHLTIMTQLFSLQKAGVRPERPAPRMLFLLKEKHQTSPTELHVTPHRLDPEPELKQSVRTNTQQLCASWISVAPVDTFICNRWNWWRIGRCLTVLVSEYTKYPEFCNISSSVTHILFKLECSHLSLLEVSSRIHLGSYWIQLLFLLSVPIFNHKHWGFFFFSFVTHGKAPISSQETQSGKQWDNS